MCYFPQWVNIVYVYSVSHDKGFGFTPSIHSENQMAHHHSIVRLSANIGMFEPVILQLGVQVIISCHYIFLQFILISN